MPKVEIKGIFSIILIMFLLVGCSEVEKQQTNFESDECGFLHYNLYLQGHKDKLIHTENNLTATDCCCVSLPLPKELLCICPNEEELKKIFPLIYCDEIEGGRQVDKSCVKRGKEDKVVENKDMG